MPLNKHAQQARSNSVLSFTALPLICLAGGAMLAAPSTARAQPQPAPYDQPWGAQPPPGQPPAGQAPTGAPYPGEQPPPYGYGQPAYGQPAPGQPAPYGTEQPPPGSGPDAGFGVEANANFGGAGFGASTGANVEPDATDEEKQWEERDRSLIEQINLLGSTGLLRTSLAGSGAEGTFRVGFLMDWFTTGGFLCNADTPCRSQFAGQAVDDEASHVGALFGLNVTPLSFLEAYAAIRTYANSNDHGSPELLQVLGDTTFGAKGFMPDRIADIVGFGGEARLLLLNGAGSVGPMGGGTSAEFLALATADFRRKYNEGIPLRLNLNLGYRLDNSGVLVEDVETLRAERDPAGAGGLGRIPISRVERFGLGINRVDFFKINFGVDVPLDYVQPYLEYTLDIPINRQGYECHTRTISPGDVCLALENLSDPYSGAPGYSAAPSRLTLGVRATPFKKAFRGLSAHAAFDIGLSGTSTFVEEVAPQAPWTLYLGLGYAFDTKERKIEAPPALPPPPPAPLPPPPEYFARGTVKEAGTSTAVAGAILSLEGGTEPPVATNGEGRFLSHKLEPGSYNLVITAEGYKPGSCPVTVTAAPPAMPPGMMGEFGAQPGAAPGTPGMGPALGPPGQPPTGAMGAPGVPPGAELYPEQAAPTGPVYVEVECQLEALPRMGDVEGTTTDATGARVNSASIEITDVDGKVHTVTASGGAFSLKGLPPGKAKVQAEAPDYMLAVSEVTIKPREAARVAITLSKRPKVGNVRVLGDQIRITKQIHFETDSAKIMGDSNELLAEIADVLHRSKEIARTEIQGHTDNTGGKDHNDRLSQARAESVREWLVQHGIDGGRLSAKGYGQSKPLVPNITPANRARNRRVQFVILEKQ